MLILYTDRKPKNPQRKEKHYDYRLQSNLYDIQQKKPFR